MSRGIGNRNKEEIPCSYVMGNDEEGRKKGIGRGVFE